MGDEQVSDLFGAIANLFVTALSLPLLGIPIYVFLLLNLAIGAVIAFLKRGE